MTALSFIRTIFSAGLYLIVLYSYVLFGIGYAMEFYDKVDFYSVAFVLTWPIELGTAAGTYDKIGAFARKPSP